MWNSWKSFIVTAATAIALTACGNVSHNVAKDGRSAGELIWPAPDSVTPMHKGGTFPNLANLRQMRAGLNKQQVSDLIGYPHFSEGKWGVREWNYVFNFRRPDTDAITVCQYKVLFDDQRMASSFYWKPESCAAFLEKPKPIAVSVPKDETPQRFRLAADALFSFDKADLADIKPEGREALSNLAAELRKHVDQVQSIHVIGYTDRLGNAVYNQKLSEARANAVRDALLKEGLPSSKIVADGRGERDPVKDCPDGPRARLVACLAPNRRVEVKAEQ